MFNVKSLSISLKIVKLNPWMNILYNTSSLSWKGCSYSVVQLLVVKIVYSNIIEYIARAHEVWDQGLYNSARNGNFTDNIFLGHLLLMLHDIFEFLKVLEGLFFWSFTKYILRMKMTEYNYMKWNTIFISSSNSYFVEQL